MTRRTKIVATLGPATDDPAVLRKLLAAGVDVVRLNFSHGKADEQRRRVEQVRSAAHELGLDIGILADLQGPKIRIESFADGPVELHEGQRFTLDTALGAQAGDATTVGCAYAELPRDVVAGDVLLLNDGAISMRVDAVIDTRVQCTVLVSGPLSNRKGINKQGGGLSAGALGLLELSAHCAAACLHWGLRDAGGYRDPMTLLDAPSPEGPRLLPLDGPAGVSAFRPRASCAGRASPSSGSGRCGSRTPRRARRPRRA